MRNILPHFHAVLDWLRQFLCKHYAFWSLDWCPSGFESFWSHSSFNLTRAELYRLFRSLLRQWSQFRWKVLSIDFALSTDYICSHQFAPHSRRSVGPLSSSWSKDSWRQKRMKRVTYCCKPLAWIVKAFMPLICQVSLRRSSWIFSSLALYLQFQHFHKFLVERSSRLRSKASFAGWHFRYFAGVASLSYYESKHYLEWQMGTYSSRWYMLTESRSSLNYFESINSPRVGITTDCSAFTKSYPLKVKVGTLGACRNHQRLKATSEGEITLFDSHRFSPRVIQGFDSLSTLLHFPFVSLMS